MQKTRPPSTLESLERRFWAKVDKRGPDECWRWIGSHNQEGRGQMYVGGPRVNDEAHRISWALHGNEVPDRWATGNVIDHICKVIDCVNPRHLRVVTHAENACELAPTGVSFKNAAKTECKHGHPFAGDNLAVVLLGTRKQRARVCLTCYPSYRNNPNRVDQ